jgi:hypothetical protein
MYLQAEATTFLVCVMYMSTIVVCVIYIQHDHGKHGAADRIRAPIAYAGA